MLAGAASPGGSVSLTVTGLRSTKGQVLICLTREADHFPDCSDSTSARTAGGSRRRSQWERIPSNVPMSGSSATDRPDLTIGRL